LFIHNRQFFIHYYSRFMMDMLKKDKENSSNMGIIDCLRIVFDSHFPQIVRNTCDTTSWNMINFLGFSLHDHATNFLQHIVCKEFFPQHKQKAGIFKSSLGIHHPTSSLVTLHKLFSRVKVPPNLKGWTSLTLCSTCHNTYHLLC
jgi:hypothetical protein